MVIDILCLIVGSIITIIAIIKNFEINVASFTISGNAILASISTFLFILGIISITTTSQPEAIDVYRNKTTLKVTYVDSVAVDSVVIFK